MCIKSIMIGSAFIVTGTVGYLKEIRNNPTKARINTGMRYCNAVITG
jgi:hypothetical protein